ncbi:uncharacterized protein [Littorina saxatilis]|uniref:uncharacterized protein n=1 Tax=Littorina saxatilis TaxID=31220 RepID=UPI0038B4212B
MLPVSICKINSSLNATLHRKLAMRQQDLALLKQLIHINDNIRRLKRSRSMRFSAARTVSCGTLGISTPSSPSSSSSSTPPEGKVTGSAGKARVATLLRQKSEPGLFGLPPRRVSTLTSTSSFETIDDAEEVDSLYGSATDLGTAPTTPGTPSSCTTPTTPVTRSSSSYTCLTFTPEELYNGESSYGEILKRNVRLWKWSVAREKDLGIVDGHLCVL